MDQFLDSLKALPGAGVAGLVHKLLWQDGQVFKLPDLVFLVVALWWELSYQVTGSGCYPSVI